MDSANRSGHPMRSETAPPTVDLRAEVNAALDSGLRPHQIDVVMRARYALEWGAGDPVHRELANEVEQHRTTIQTMRTVLTRWAQQDNDYDEDTEQQISDAHQLLAELGEPCDGCINCKHWTHEARNQTASQEAELVEGDSR